eukprot:4195106-Prorocentrum_lima.AAC.1
MTSSLVGSEMCIRDSTNCTQGIASERERLNLWEKAFEDMRVEKRGSHANPIVAVSLPPVTRAVYTREVSRTAIATVSLPGQSAAFEEA